MDGSESGEGSEGHVGELKRALAGLLHSGPAAS